MSKHKKSFRDLMNTEIRTAEAILIIFLSIAILSASEIFTLNKMTSNIDNVEVAEEYINLEEAKNSGTGITYYVSANGTSQDGTDINNPMSLNTAKSKKYNGNDKVLFKSGDLFYGTISFDISTIEDDFFYIGSYGEGEKPIISGAKIANDIWKKDDEQEDIYTTDLTNKSNFTGYQTTSTNVGFIADEQGNIYGNRKKEKSLLEKEMDFYIENKKLYIKCSKDPYEKYGELKLTTQNHLVKLSSNTILDDLNIQYTGAHGIIRKTNETNNIYIKNCIIQNIGGSVQVESSFTRYGNGIEFWHQATNTLVENCIIRNIYDAGYTTQGNSVTEDLGFHNNICKNNIFINCTYDIEMFCRNDSDKTAICNLLSQQIYNNISINQGRGWGYEVRPNKYPAATYVVWNIQKDNTSVSFENNKYYNPLRLEYIYSRTIDITLFKNGITSNNNKWYLNKGTYMINDNTNKEILSEYGIEVDSTFKTLSEKQLELINNQSILNSNNYEEIKQYYESLDNKFEMIDILEEITTDYEELQTQCSEAIRKNEELRQKIENIKERLSNKIKTLEIQQSEIEKLLTETYELGNMVIETERENLGESIKAIYLIANKYNELLELCILENSTSEEDFTNKLKELEEKLNKNKDEENAGLLNTLYNLANNYNNQYIAKDNSEPIKSCWEIQIKGLTGWFEKIFDLNNPKLIQIVSNENYQVVNNYIKDILYNTSVTEFNEKLATDAEYTIQRNGQLISADESIATGDILKTSAGLEYTLIVSGDITKDGAVNIKDIVKLRTYLLEGNNLSDIELMAADCDNDGKDITIKDLVQMRIIVLTH